MVMASTEWNDLVLSLLFLFICHEIFGCTNEMIRRCCSHGWTKETHLKGYVVYLANSETGANKVWTLGGNSARRCNMFSGNVLSSDHAAMMATMFECT